jgi:hypothetical protein
MLTIGECKMDNNLSLNENHKPYAPASATNVQRTWKRVCNWVPPSKDEATIAKWDYYKSLTMRSEAALQFTKETK